MRKFFINCPITLNLKTLLRSSCKAVSDMSDTKLTRSVQNRFREPILKMGFTKKQFPKIQDRLHNHFCKLVLLLQA